MTATNTPNAAPIAAPVAEFTSYTPVLVAVLIARHFSNLGTVHLSSGGFYVGAFCRIYPM